MKIDLERQAGECIFHVSFPTASQLIVSFPFNFQSHCKKVPSGFQLSGATQSVWRSRSRGETQTLRSIILPRM